MRFNRTFQCFRAASAAAVFAIVALVGTEVAAAAFARQTSTSSSKSFTFEHRISAATNRSVCAETQGDSTSAPFVSSSRRTYVECPGACPWDALTAQTGWWRFQPTYQEGGCVAPAACGGSLPGNSSAIDFTCPEIATVKGSCIQSPSNGCKFLGVFLNASYTWGSHASSSHYEISCAGPENGTCTWYSDAGCTQIIAPGKPPVAGGGTRCVKLPNPEAYQGYNDKYDGWCNESISQLVRRIPPAECRDPVPSSTTSTTTIGRRPQMTCPTPSVFPECTLPAPPIPPIPLRYGNWVCEPTCSYKWQPWLLIRTVVTDGYKHSLQCQGPNESSCTFYNDSQCSIPVPGQPPQLPGNNNTGLVCNDTSRPWWCGAITNYHYPYSNTSPYTWHCNYTRYMCIESCSDGRKKNIGVWLDPEDRISCVWNKTAGSCVEFPDIRCYNDSRESYEDPLGPGCNDEGGGWCKDASDVLRRNGSPTCVLATSTASSQSTPTGSAVPNGAGRTWRSYGGLAFLVPAMLSLFHSF